MGVLELGTNSLKLHVSTDSSRPAEPSRVEWDLGYEVYSSGQISEKTIGTALGQVRALLAEHGLRASTTPVFGIATGAFRDAENTKALLDRLLQEERIPLRVLSREEEASLLIEGASHLVQERPGMAFDLGGGSLEMVFFGKDGCWLREALPLGAIWLHHLGLIGSGVWDEGPACRWIEKTLQHARPFRLGVIHGTGGTVKAIAQVAGTASISLDLLVSLEHGVRIHGPPDSLSPRRRGLFLPGLMAVRLLAEHLQARTLRYARVDLGEVLLGRLRPFLGALREAVCRTALFEHLEIFETPPGGTVGSGAVGSG
jgi:exopolyphosphatase/pppGpp-phosphohydrolase